MFYNGRGVEKAVGLALLFIGIGMLISVLLGLGWFLAVIAIILIVIGTYLACLC